MTMGVKKSIMAKKTLHVALLTHTPDVENTISMAARLCYSGAHIDELMKKTQAQDQAGFIQKLVDMGHLSPIEHVSFTYGIEGVSRALLAQITRHRIASFSVQSQRYVSQSKQGLQYILPPSIERLGAEAIEAYDTQMNQMQSWYEEWCEKLGAEKKEDARFVLPNACETRIVMTVNARELIHFFRLRCCERAQWEIRALAWVMLGHALRAAPVLFSHAGPSCVSGACSEGNMSCGRLKEIREQAQSLTTFVSEIGHLENFGEKLETWAQDRICVG